MLLNPSRIRVTLLVAFVAPVLACGGSDGGRPFLRALVLSDLNGASGSLRYPAEVSHAVALARGEMRPDLVLIPGDMVAGQAPDLPDRRVHAMWASFDATVAAPLREAGIPLVVTLGNHDAAAQARHARDRRIATQYWRDRIDRNDLPFVDREHFPHRYSVRFDDVFIVVWDATNAESGRDDDLIDWLGDALESDAARDASHRVVLAHLPLYDVTAPPYYPDGVLADADALRRKLEKWEATMMVTGHHHAYYPGRRGTLELMHAGSLGTYPRPLNGGDGRPLKTITVLDFYRDSVHVAGFEIDSVSGAAMPIPLEILPRAICAQNGWVARRDLVAMDTTCARASWWRGFIDRWAERLGFQ